MSKNYDQYEIKITPMHETSFDDGQLALNKENHNECI